MGTLRHIDCSRYQLCNWFLVRSKNQKFLLLSFLREHVFPLRPFCTKPLASFSTLIPKRLGHCQWLQWYQLCNRFLPRIANVLETWHRKWQHISSCSSCTKTAKHWITFTQDKFYSVGETCNTQSTWSKKCSNSVIQSILFCNLIKSYITVICQPNFPK